VHVLRSKGMTIFEIGVQRNGPIHFMATIRATQIVRRQHQQMLIGLILKGIHLPNQRLAHLEPFPVN